VWCWLTVSQYLEIQREEGEGPADEEGGSTGEAEGPTGEEEGLTDEEVSVVRFTDESVARK